MRLKKLIIIGVIASTFLTYCKKDDKNTIETVPPRDRGEQEIDDDEAIIAYLQTHFYNAEDFQNPTANFNYVVDFDTISGDNSSKTPIIDSDLLTTKTVRRDSIDYTIYILKLREGAGDKPTFADSTFQNYKGELLKQDLFDNTINPVWFDHPGVGTQTNPGIAVVGLTQAMLEFGEASGFSVNEDNTVTWNNDFGIGAVFLPSGLGYFNSSPPNIPAYSPLIFSFQLYGVNEADHDNDGIPSYMEDLDGNGILYNDDTRTSGLPNYLNADDDLDGTPTRDEIIINSDGSIEFPDTNSNGTPDYLDQDSF